MAKPSGPSPGLTLCSQQRRRKHSPLVLVPISGDVQDMIVVRPQTPNQPYGDLSAGGLPSPPNTLGTTKRTTSSLSNLPVLARTLLGVSVPTRGSTRPSRTLFTNPQEPTLDTVRSRQGKRKAKGVKQQIRRWDDAEINTLCTIKAVSATLSWNDATALLNDIFKQNNLAQGVTRFRPSSVRAQFSDLKAGRNRGRSGMWLTVCQRIQRRSQHDPLLDEVIIHAQRLGIDLTSDESRIGRGDANRGVGRTERNRNLEHVSGSKARSPQIELPQIKVEAQEVLLKYWQPTKQPVPHIITTDESYLAHRDVALVKLGFVGSFFRCQSPGSGSYLQSDGSIRAGAFTKESPITRAPSPCHSVFLREAQIHMSRLEVFTTSTMNFDKADVQCIPTQLVSVTESFMDMFLRCYREWRTDHRHINTDMIVINSAALCRQVAVFNARPIMKTLRDQGMLRFHHIRRYRGAFERLVWGEIPASAITSCTPFNKFMAKAQASQGVARITRITDTVLETAKSVKNTRIVFARKLKETLDECTAKGIGELLRLYQVDVHSRFVIAHFVYCIVDGFVIRVNCSGDQLPVRFVKSFLKGARSTTSALEDGFARGVRLASESLEREFGAVERKR